MEANELLEKATAENKAKGQSYNFTDQELIRQLAKSRNAQGQELEFEDLSGYELPPRTQFSMLSKPAVSIKYGELTFNMASIRLFEDTFYVLTPVNRDKKRLMVVPCKEEESQSLQWARIQKSDQKKVSRTITSEEFVLKIYHLMGWNLNCRYKVMGRVALLKPGPVPVLVFDLEEAIMFDSTVVEIKNEATGEIKKKQVKYYPEEYKDRIGKSYSDYVQSKQMTIFEFMEEYAGQSYSDLIDNSDNAADNSAGNSPDNAENGENLTASLSGNIPAENSLTGNSDTSGVDSIAPAENPTTDNSDNPPNMTEE